MPRRPLIGQLCVEYGCILPTAEGYMDILVEAGLAEDVGPRVRISQREREREREAKPVKEGKKGAKGRKKA